MITASKLTSITENQQKVFDAGKLKGRDDFWEAFQLGGLRDNYSYAFYCEKQSTGKKGDYWSDANFYPKYDVVVTNYSFTSCCIKNLKQRLIDCGVSLIPSTNMGWAFRTTTITHIPDLSDVACTNADYIFYNCQSLVSVDGINFDKSITRVYSPFLYDYSLQDVIVYGTIGFDISFRDSSKLTADSMKSIISCLKNCKGTDDERRFTITFHNTAWNRLESDSLSPTGATWKEYVQEELGWNI